MHEYPRYMHLRINTRYLVITPLQCAEGLRAACMPDWLQLTGLLHDLGKMVCSK